MVQINENIFTSLFFFGKYASYKELQVLEPPAKPVLLIALDDEEEVVDKQGTNLLTSNSQKQGCIKKGWGSCRKLYTPLPKRPELLTEPATLPARLRDYRFHFGNSCLKKKLFTTLLNKSKQKSFCYQIANLYISRCVKNDIFYVGIGT